MRLLLDTHIILWLLVEPMRLSEDTKVMISESELFMSSISVFEIQHKRKLGKLNVEINFQELMEAGIFTPLSLKTKHAEYCINMPLIHRDPFDRILIAQSIVEKIPLITADTLVQQYDFNFIKA